jgi:membrane protein DedA with SNARE-associated domain
MKFLPTLEYLVHCYGYWAILVGTFFEGETILILGGFIASLGYLKLTYVMGIAFLGSFSGDQFYFFIGRLKGKKILYRFKKTQGQVEKIHKFLNRYNDLIMLGFRFIYGIRVLTPIVLATNNKVSARRFFVFNAIGALIWSVVVSLGGYVFGEALEVVIKDIKHYQLGILAAIIIIAFLVWIFHHLKGKG